MYVKTVLIEVNRVFFGKNNILVLENLGFFGFFLVLENSVGTW